MSRTKKWAKGPGIRDSGGFVALPFAVLDSMAYQNLSHPAKALLLEIARQYKGDNNGRLLASIAYLRKRGWKSSDVIARAKRALLDAGLIYQTVLGHRPNKASWYAITWVMLDRLHGYDLGALEGFERGAYRGLRVVPVEAVPKLIDTPFRTSEASLATKMESLVRLAA